MHESAVQALEAIAAHGVDLAGLGIAYLLLLGNLATCAVLYLSARAYLVISPNSGARDYGLYMAAALLTLLVATVLENRLTPLGFTALPYASTPHLALLFMLHLGIYYRQEPWLVALGVSAAAGALLVLGLAVAATDHPRPAHWLAMGLTAGLLGFVWMKSISTKRGFLKAQSIYASSKEQRRTAREPQRPWLGLAQWVALVAASLALAAVNELLGGGSLAQIPAVQVLGGGSLLIAVTALVSSIPAATYWFTRKAWMPELTRFVWLVWLVVGFAFTYGNFLTRLEQA